MAARGGYLSMLKWMRENECPWDIRTCCEAGKTGKLEVLKWIRGQHPRWVFGADKNAARYGHLHILEWLLQEKLLFDPLPCFAEAARGGHLHVLKWLLEHDCCTPISLCTKFIRNDVVKCGSLEVIQWFRSEVITGPDGFYDRDFAHDAAYYGHLRTLEWLHEEYKHPFDKEDCAEASRGGHLDVLKWLRERGCPWDRYTTYFARDKGFEEIFEWARSHGCPYDGHHYAGPVVDLPESIGLFGGDMDDSTDSHTFMDEMSDDRLGILGDEETRRILRQAGMIAGDLPMLFDRASDFDVGFFESGLKNDFDDGITIFNQEVALKEAGRSEPSLRSKRQWAKYNPEDYYGCPYDEDFDGESIESDPDGWYEDDDPEIESS